MYKSNPNPNPLDYQRIWEKWLNPDLTPNPDLDLPAIVPSPAGITNTTGGILAFSYSAHKKSVSWLQLTSRADCISETWTWPCFWNVADIGAKFNVI